MSEYSFPTQCETGAACGAALGANSSFAQGKQFLEMNSKFHGGRRTRRMRGGAVAELASFPNSFSPSILPEDLHATAGVAPLDKAIADLAQFRQAGGRRFRTRRVGGSFSATAGPVNAPGMLLTPAEEAKAYLNPQWYNENVVNPNFQGPASPKVGGSRKSRKSRKNHRKSSRKNHRKSSRKNMTGGKRRKGSHKGSRKSRKSRKSHKGSRKH
jgi:hypothetical protein